MEDREGTVVDHAPEALVDDLSGGLAVGQVPPRDAGAAAVDARFDHGARIRPGALPGGVGWQEVFDQRPLLVIGDMKKRHGTISAMSRSTYPPNTP